MDTDVNSHADETVMESYLNKGNTSLTVRGGRSRSSEDAPTVLLGELLCYRCAKYYLVHNIIPSKLLG